MGKYKLEYCEQLAKEHLLVRSVPNVSSKSFHLLLSVLVSECAWNPLATHVVCAGAGAKLQNGTLGILSGGHDLFYARKITIKKRDEWNTQLKWLVLINAPRQEVQRHLQVRP